MQFNGDSSFEIDSTVDASLFGIFYFECFAADDGMVANTMQAIKERLSAGGGLSRYESDGYMRSAGENSGNVWIICTLWLADYYIACAKKKEDLAKALDIIKWIAASALPSGVLSEQLNPMTGEPVSVSPLTWSHSTFVATVMNYVSKIKDLD